jgi:hypothetical protein
MNIDCQTVGRIRKERSCSLQEARRIALKMKLLEDTEKATTVEQLQVLLIRLIHAAL